MCVIQLHGPSTELYSCTPAPTSSRCRPAGRGDLESAINPDALSERVVPEHHAPFSDTGLPSASDHSSNLHFIAHMQVWAHLA